MADMVPEQTDVNSQVADAVSSSADAQVVAANTPAAEHAVAAKPENKIPQSRFNDVIQERNSEREARERLESRVRELESGKSEQFKRPSVADAEVQRLVKELDMEESAARAIVKTYENLNAAQRRDHEVAQSRFQAETWATQKAEKDPLYKSIEPELDRSFSALKPEMQTFIASNADALEMFYDSVKSRHVGSQSKDSYSKGAEDALKNKLAKQAVSSVPGSSNSGGKTALTRKSIADMIKNDISQYVKRQAEINEAVRNGTLK